jgi:hypothetical protein
MCAWGCIVVGKMVLTKKWARKKDGAHGENNYWGRSWVGYRMGSWIKCVLKDG